MLRDYHPGVHPGAFDILQLSRLSDMNRLQKVQGYLDKRCKTCRFQNSPFLDPTNNSFALQYYRKANDSDRLRQLKDTIIADSPKSRKEKLQEMESLNAKHSRLCTEISTSSCACERDAKGKIHGKRCKHCLLKRERKLLRLKGHEDFLPCDELQDQVVLFELAIPDMLADYQKITWSILNTLGFHAAACEEPPKALLSTKEWTWTSFDLGLPFSC